MKAKTFRWISFPIIGVIIAIFLAITIVCGILADTITLWVCGYKVNVDPSQVQATRQEGEKLADQIEGEGIVMTKNDNVLPLSKTAHNKVNVFGWSATQWIVGGSGSGRVVNEKNGYTADTGLIEALSAYDIQVNTSLIEMYKKFQGTRPFISNGSLNTYNYQFSRLYEPNISLSDNYNATMLQDAENFSDTAFVVIGRVSGESNDSPRVQYKGVYNSASAKEDSSRTYLEISTEEEKLLQYVGSAFKNVVVIVNSTNTMELGFMDTIEGLDACLIVGATGINAATAIPKVIYGDVNPSGKTVDTYAYNLNTNASFMNAGAEGERYYTNTSGLYPNDGTTNGNVGNNPKYTGVSYVDYAEGIYIGYKWYETADTEKYWDSVSNEYGKGYEGVVQYPFGYGLSYSTFSWEIVALSQKNNTTLTKDGKIELTVRVTNLGSKDGQDVVQLYYTPPYIANGIEKASINLCAFGKTSILKPGEYEDVKLSFKVEDMASYDCYDKNKNSFAGYELDKGKYQIKLMKNAHTIAEVVSTAQSAQTRPIIEYNADQAIKYEIDSVSKQTVSNKFTGDDAIDGVAVDGVDSGADITYMTRANFAASFPSALKEARALGDKAKTLNLYTDAMANDFINAGDSAVTMNANNGLKVYNADGTINNLGLELGADYNNSQWDALLDQLTFDEMRNLVLHGYVQTKPLNSVGKPRHKDADGPSQIGSFNMPEHGTGFPNPTVIAQTFNTKLAYSFGLAVGKEAGNLGFDGWYAPGVNIHRTPFGGRNYEYYSEDAFISGIMSANTIKAAKNTGVYTYVKHLALYEQESNRDSLYTWLTEQSLREIYLKPFKIAIDEGGASGIMTAYGRIGAVWAGGSYGLMTGVVREEWGFKGAMITDYSDHHTFMNMDQALRAGGDLWMDGFGDQGKFRFETSSNTFKQNLRRASKNVLYMSLNALYTNSEYNADNDVDPIVKGTKTEVFPWWIPLLVGIDVLVLGACGFWGFMAIRKKDKSVAQ